MSSRPILSLRLPRTTKDALYRNGYETVQDILSATPISIARDLNISNLEAEEIVEQAQNPSTQNNNGVPLTQSAATIVNSMRKFTTRWSPLDKLLKGGIAHGHILEISGPPGCPKETIAIDIAISVLQAGERVIFVDCQNMTSVCGIRDRIISAGLSSHLASLNFIRLLSPTELMVFLNSINVILDSKPRISLLVFNSLSFPFSTLPNPRLKPGIMEQVGRVLSHISAVRKLAIVITSQLANKMVKEDGSPGTFDQGARGVMMPQLDPGTAYLPSGRFYRVCLSLESPTAGTMYLLSDTSQRSTTQIMVQKEAYTFPQA